jgi:hypothetical protein
MPPLVIVVPAATGIQHGRRGQTRPGAEQRISAGDQSDALEASPSPDLVQFMLPVPEYLKEVTK